MALPSGPSVSAPTSSGSRSPLHSSIRVQGLKGPDLGVSKSPGMPVSLAQSLVWVLLLVPLPQTGFKNQSVCWWTTCRVGRVVAIISITRRSSSQPPAAPPMAHLIVEYTTVGFWRAMRLSLLRVLRNTHTPLSGRPLWVGLARQNSKAASHPSSCPWQTSPINHNAPNHRT